MQISNKNGWLAIPNLRYKRPSPPITTIQKFNNIEFRILLPVMVSSQYLRHPVLRKCSTHVHPSINWKWTRLLGKTSIAKRILTTKKKRYIIIYTWKVLEGLVPNPVNQIIQINNDRRGRRCGRKQLPKTSTRIRTLVDNSIIHLGPKLFNCLPRSIRNLSGCRVETFKKHLDTFLKTVKDEPHIFNCPRQRAAQSNSLPDQLLASEASDSGQRSTQPALPPESTHLNGGGRWLRHGPHKLCAAQLVLTLQVIK